MSRHNSGLLTLIVRNQEINRSDKIIMIFIAYDQLAYGDNCFELFEELENDVTYNEAKDHCKNLNGTLINENRISDVVMV